MFSLVKVVDVSTIRTLLTLLLLLGPLKHPMHVDLQLVYKIQPSAEEIVEVKS
jgi:hypothetical protein